MFLRAVICLIGLLLYFVYDVSGSTNESQWSIYVKDQYYDLHFWTPKEPSKVVKLNKYENNTNLIEFPETKIPIELCFALTMDPFDPPLNDTLLNVWQNKAEKITLDFHWYADGIDKFETREKGKTNKTSYYYFLINKNSAEIVSTLNTSIEIVPYMYYKYNYTGEKSYTLVLQENITITCLKIKICNNTMPKNDSACQNETVPCTDLVLDNDISVHTKICTLKSDNTLNCHNIILSKDFDPMTDSLELNKIISYENEPNTTLSDTQNDTETLILKRGDNIKCVMIVHCNSSLLINNTLKNTEMCIKIVPCNETSDYYKHTEKEPKTPEICKIQFSSILKCRNITLFEDFLLLNNTLDLNKLVKYKYKQNVTFDEEQNDEETFLLKYADNVKCVKFIRCDNYLLFNNTFMTEVNENNKTDGNNYLTEIEWCLNLVSCNELLFLDDSLKTKSDSEEIVVNEPKSPEICKVLFNETLDCRDIILSENNELLNETLEFNKTITYNYNHNVTFGEAQNETVTFVLKYRDNIKCVMFINCNDLFNSTLSETQSSTKSINLKDKEKCLRIVPCNDPLLHDKLLKTKLFQKILTFYEQFDNGMYRETKIYYNMKKITWMEPRSTVKYETSNKMVATKEHRLTFKLKCIPGRVTKKKSNLSAQDKNVLIFIVVAIAVAGILCYGVRRYWCKPSDYDPSSNIVPTSEPTSTGRFQELPDIQRTGAEASTSTADNDLLSKVKVA